MTEEAKRGGPRPGSGRPKKADGARHVHATLSLPPDVAALVAMRADEERVTRSEAVARCLREWAGFKFQAELRA